MELQVDKHTYNRLGDVIGETHPPERHDKALELVSDIVNNIWNGQLYSNFWQVEAGRLFQTPALFLLGMLAGRLELFVKSTVSVAQQQQAKNGQSDDRRYRGPDFIPEVQTPVVVDKHTYNRLGDVIGETHDRRGCGEIHQPDRFFRCGRIS